MFDLGKLKGMRIAITGGAGFIGHNVALKLAELGASPHVIDGLQVNNIGFYTSGYSVNSNAERYIAFINERLNLLRKSKVGLHIIDIRDYQVLSRTLSEIKPQVIIHLAAIAHANRSNKDPFSTFDHSMRTLENVLDNSRSGDTHIIYFSSSMVYGDFNDAAVSEESICQPKGIYGALKYGAEKLVIGYNQVYDIPYTIIRPSALYGERCVSRRVGQAFIENALSGKNLTINGDGEEGLDFTYIDDLLQGVILCVTKKESINETFNITYGEARKLNQLASIVREHFPGVEIEYKSRDNLMPERGTLSIEKAKELLGYKPHSPVEVGFVKYIQWYKEFAAENPELFD
ncbi:MAG: NAD-dependent epimerase/dehydratase family protein [Burkholderiales bacterium]|nr:NAD-dependent epimerase/dehydratase family protein [Burkholderiales bacterium]